jgi:hypothetical protein
MDEPPKEPTALAFELPAELREFRQQGLLKIERAKQIANDAGEEPYRTGLRVPTWEEAAYHVGLRHKLSASEVSTLCAQVRVWVEFQRRREARRMGEDELRAFRQHLTWTPRTAVWKAFSAFMADRNGEWKMRLATHLGAYDAAQAAMRGQGTAEFLEAADEARRLCAELPEDWDPRPVERFPRGIPPERQALWKATPFRRYVG